MARPVRIQLRRTKGWRMPANTVKVDRTTKWGNPFVPGQMFEVVDMEWMNWGGWRWISAFIALGAGVYVGWSVRSTNARSADVRREMKDGPAIALVKHMASLKDPHDCPSIDDEIEAWAHVIDTAKSIYGDLSEEDWGGHPDE